MAEIKFEDGLKRLEKIVDELEAGNIPLDDALNKYEEGVRLSKICAKKLDAAKKKVELLLKSEDGSVELKPFDEKEFMEDRSAQDVKKKKTASQNEPG